MVFVSITSTTVENISAILIKLIRYGESGVIFYIDNIKLMLN